jgi:hypothetical protein
MNMTDEEFLEPIPNVTQPSGAPPSVLVKDLSDHLALVTGATGGIGKATCRALADIGCSVAVHYYQNEQASTDLVNELKAKGVRAHAFQADLGGYKGVCMHNIASSPIQCPQLVRGSCMDRTMYCILSVVTSMTGQTSSRRSNNRPRPTNRPLQQQRSNPWHIRYQVNTRNHPRRVRAHVASELRDGVLPDTTMPTRHGDGRLGQSHLLQ